MILLRRIVGTKRAAILPAPYTAMIRASSGRASQAVSAAAPAHPLAATGARSIVADIAPAAHNPSFYASYTTSVDNGRVFAPRQISALPHHPRSSDAIRWIPNSPIHCAPTVTQSLSDSVTMSQAHHSQPLGLSRERRAPVCRSPRVPLAAGAVVRPDPDIPQRVAHPTSASLLRERH